jgi:hypothetical protein
MSQLRLLPASHCTGPDSDSVPVHVIFVVESGKGGIGPRVFFRSFTFPLSFDIPPVLQSLVYCLGLLQWACLWPKCHKKMIWYCSLILFSWTQQVNTVFFCFSLMSSDPREKTRLGQETDNTQCISVSCDWPPGIREVDVVPLFHRRYLGGEVRKIIVLCGIRWTI